MGSTNRHHPRIAARRGGGERVMAQSDLSPSAPAENTVDTQKRPCLPGFNSLVVMAVDSMLRRGVGTRPPGAGWNPAASPPGTCRGGSSHRRLGEEGSVRVLPQSSKTRIAARYASPVSNSRWPLDKAGGFQRKGVNKKTFASCASSRLVHRVPSCGLLCKSRRGMAPRERRPAVEGA